MAHSFHFGDTIDSLTDMSGTDYNVTAVGDSNALAPTVDVASYDLPAMAVQHIYTPEASSRSISIPCFIIGTSATNLRTRVDNTFALVGTGNNSGYLRLDTWPTRIYKGRFVTPGESARHGASGISFTLNFQCEGLYSYELPMITQTITISSNPQTFIVPGTSGTTVGGTTDPSPVWVIKNASSFTEYELTLKNNTTSETIDVWALANTYWLRLDYDRQIVETSSNNGTTWTSAMWEVGTNANIPKLSSGSSNSITLTGISSGSVVLAYYERYI